MYLKELKGKILLDQRDWSGIPDNFLENFDFNQEKFGKYISEILYNLLVGEDNDFKISLPFLWYPDDGHGNKAPKDPLTIRIFLPLCNTEGEEPYFDVSFTKLLIEEFYLNDKFDKYDLRIGTKSTHLKIINALKKMVTKLESMKYEEGE